MLEDLFNVLVELLLVYTNKLPVGVGQVAAEGSMGVVAVVLGISSPSIVGVDELQTERRGEGLYGSSRANLLQ